MYKLKTNALAVKDYQALRGTTNWSPVPNHQVQKALEHDLFSVCAYVNGKAVGMGRIIGDGAIYFYIQDLIVHPELQGKGVGTAIMTAMEAFLDQTVKGYAFVGLMAADGVEAFYRGFGYTKRNDTSPGMFKVIQK